MRAAGCGKGSAHEGATVQLLWPVAYLEAGEGERRGKQENKGKNSKGWSVKEGVEKNGGEVWWMRERGMQGE